MKCGKRYVFIDALYTLGTFLVILGHSHLSDWNTFTNTFLEKLILFIYVFHMPLFFFIAGFLFSNSRKIEKIGLVKWIKEKAIKLLVPYVVLSMLAALPKYYFEQGSWDGIAEYLFRATFIPRAGVWGHFWFLPVLMIVYLIFGISRKLLNRQVPLRNWIICSVFTIILYFLPIETEWLGINDIKKMLVYFLFGMIINEFGSKWNLDKHKPSYDMLLFSILVILISWILIRFYYGNEYITFVVSLIMIYSCLMISLGIKENSITLWISRHNFTIYIYSWPFQAIAMEICSRLSISWYSITIIMFITGLVMPIILIILYQCLEKVHCQVFDLILGVK